MDKMAGKNVDTTQNLENYYHFTKIILCISVTESHHHKLLWWSKKLTKARCILQRNMQLLLQIPPVREKGGNKLSVWSQLPLVSTANEFMIMRGNTWSVQMPLMAFPAAGCQSCFPFDHIVPFPVCPQHCYSYWYSVFQAINNVSFNICIIKHSGFTYFFSKNDYCIIIFFIDHSYNTDISTDGRHCGKLRW